MPKDDHFRKPMTRQTQTVFEWLDGVWTLEEVIEDLREKGEDDAAQLIQSMGEAFCDVVRFEKVEVQVGKLWDLRGHPKNTAG